MACNVLAGPVDVLHDEVVVALVKGSLELNVNTLLTENGNLATTGKLAKNHD